MNPKTILNYWFSDSLRPHWFASTPAIDDDIRQRFESTWEQARDGLLDNWKDTAEGCLALCIILDQFPLNMFRGKAKSFSTESLAIEVTMHALGQGFVGDLSAEQKSFLFMPLMHSENLQHQQLSVLLFKKHELTHNLSFAVHHMNLIQTYGRFPHRNDILGRESSQDEINYLNSDGAFKG